MAIKGRTFRDESKIDVVAAKVWSPDLNHTR
jgi:hypothetical protein